MIPDIRAKTAEAIANKIRMLRKAVHTGSFLLIEGEDDAKLFRKLINSARCLIQIAHGKPNVIGALAILEREGFRGILAIADADFEALEGRTSHSPNLLVTDTHDLETMLLASPAFEALLIERGDAAKIEDLGGILAARGKLLDTAKPVSYLRWHNDREKRWLRFDDLDIDQFVDDKTLAVSREALLRHLRNRSKSLISVPDDELWSRAEALKDSGHDLWHLCCGHDIVRILSVALRKVFGSNNPADVKPSRLEESLRLAYNLAHFQVTWLWAAIVAWEAKNPDYVVLTRGALPA
jgi:hypothetical protein